MRRFERSSGVRPGVRAEQLTVIAAAAMLLDAGSAGW